MVWPSLPGRQRLSRYHRRRWFSSRGFVIPPSAQAPALPDRATAIELLRGAALDFHHRGWCLGGAGDLSAAIAVDPAAMLITRSGCDKHRLTEADFVVIGPDGHALKRGVEVPADAHLHATIAAVTRARSVLHTHSVWATLAAARWREAGGLTFNGFEMLRALEGVDSHQADVFVPVLAIQGEPRQLAEHVVQELSEWPGAPAFLIAGHGLYTWGTTIAAARRHVEVLEFLLECVGRRDHGAGDPTGYPR